MADQQFFARLASANAGFASRLPAILERLDALGARLDPRSPADVAGELQAMLHTLAGAAATFGYRGLGRHARALEQRLRVLNVFGAAAAGEWAAWIGELGRLVDAARCDPHGIA